MKFWIITLLSVFLLFSCKKEAIIPEPEPPAKVLLRASADTLTFFNNETKSLFLWSADYWTGFKYSVISQPDWISITPSTGFVVKEKYEIKLTTNLNINSPISREGKVVIYTDYGSKEIFIKGIIKENVIFDLPDSLFIDFFESGKKFKIKNRGNIQFNYSTHPSNDYITVTPSAGYLAVDDEAEITIKVNSEKLSNGKYNSFLFFDFNNVKDTVKVSIENNNNVVTNLMAEELVDAEYCKSKDILAYVTISPRMLVVNYTNKLSFDKFVLSDNPLCVSISPDGTKAVVGFDGYISTFDLTQHKFLKSYPVTCRATDVIVAPSQIAYIFTDEQLYSPRSINTNDLLATEKIHSNVSIWGDKYFRFHPSGNYIYGIQSILKKYEIQPDSIKYIGDAPNWNEYNFGRNFWISEEGKYIFTGAKGVFKSSNDRVEDMIYLTSFNDESNANYFLWLDQSAQNNEIYAIVDFMPDNLNLYHPNITKIFAYNADSFAFKRFYELKKYRSTDYLGNPVNYEANPRFVFCNQAGDKLFVFTKAFESELNYPWALQEIKIEKQLQ